MTATIHKANTRGYADHGWLKSYHSFSFADYFNPERMGFGLLRVLNDDLVNPGMGFGTHPHKDMEIISIPLSGELAHKDSMGHTEVIHVDEVQVMSAGIGITHSEFNASRSEPVSFLQIWIIPDKLGVQPRYDQRKFARADASGNWQLLVSPDGRGNSLQIHQKAYISRILVEKNDSIKYIPHENSNGIYFFVIEGDTEIGGQQLSQRDSIRLTGHSDIELKGSKSLYLLAVEVPMQSQN